MIDLNKNPNTGQIVMNFYEPMEIKKKKKNSQEKEQDSVVSTNVTVIKVT